jgi:hypothetical protein
MRPVGQQRHLRGIEPRSKINARTGPECYRMDALCFARDGVSPRRWMALFETDTLLRMSPRNDLSCRRLMRIDCPRPDVCRLQRTPSPLAGKGKRPQVGQALSGRPRVASESFVTHLTCERAEHRPSAGTLQELFALSTSGRAACLIWRTPQLVLPEHGPGIVRMMFTRFSGQGQAASRIWSPL